jgi:hypothetical protein
MSEVELLTEAKLAAEAERREASQAMSIVSPIQIQYFLIHLPRSFVNRKTMATFVFVMRHSTIVALGVGSTTRFRFELRSLSVCVQFCGD